MLVNQKELADCLGISARQVRNLKNEGMFETEKNSRKYNLQKCVREYVDFKINAETGKGTSASGEKIKAEHEEIKKQISILKLRKLKRQLHKAEDVEFFLSDMLMKFKRRLLDLPTKLAIKVSGESDINSIISIIREDILTVLDELSAYDPDKIDRQEDESYEDNLEKDEEEDE